MLAAVLDRREAAGHVAVERRVAHRHLALVAGGQQHAAGLVRDRHQQHAAAARLDVLLGGIGLAAGELILQRLERRLEHVLDRDRAQASRRALCACAAASSRLICEV